jgi:hypothetical protein
VCVPESSPREMKLAPCSATRRSAAPALAMPSRPAGSAGGPRMTKSFYITSRRSMPNPSATK